MKLFKFGKMLDGPPPMVDAVQEAIDQTAAALKEAVDRRERANADLEEALLSGDADAVASAREGLTAAQDEATSYGLGLDRLQSTLVEAEKNAERDRVEAGLAKGRELSVRGQKIIAEYGDTARKLIANFKDLEAIELAIAEANSQAAEAGHVSRVLGPNAAMRNNPTATFTAPPLTSEVILPAVLPGAVDVWPPGLTSIPRGGEYANERSARVAQLLRE